MFVVEMWGYFWDVCMCIAFFLYFFFSFFSSCCLTQGKSHRVVSFIQALKTRGCQNLIWNPVKALCGLVLLPAWQGCSRETTEVYSVLGEKGSSFCGTDNTSRGEVKGEDEERWEWDDFITKKHVYLVFKDCAGKGLISSNTVLIDWLQLQW